MSKKKNFRGGGNFLLWGKKRKDNYEFMKKWGANILGEEYTLGVSGGRISQEI